MFTNEFRFVVIPGRSHVPQESEFLSRTYEMWNGVWTEALQELDGTSRIKSDDFTRHDHLGVLCHGETPIGSCSFSVVDLTQAHWRADSYFEAWPEETLRALGQAHAGPNVLVCCYFTLAKDWRRDSAGFSAKRLLTALAVEHFLASACETMVGTMRVNRGMHTLCYDAGALALHRAQFQHGVEVDLIHFLKPQTAVNLHPFKKEAREIYHESQLRSNLGTNFKVGRRIA